jgi:outer membrane protein assembly factor BamB
MKTFQCTNCGFLIQRATQPFSCPQCGRQAIGLFRVAAGGPAAPVGAWPAQPATAPMQPGIPVARPAMPQTPVQPVQPGYPVGRAGMAPLPPQPVQPGIPATRPGIPTVLPGAPVGRPQYPPPQQPHYAPPPAQPPAPPYVQPVVDQPPPSLPAEPPKQPSKPAKRRAVPPERAQPPEAKRAALPPTKPAPPQPDRAKPEKPQPAPPPTTERSEARKAEPPKAVAPAPKPPAREPSRATAAARPAEPPKAAPKPKPRPKPIRPEQFLWAFPEEPPFEEESTPIRNAPAVDAAGRIFLHIQGRLLAMEEHDGRPQVVWEYVTGSRAPGPAVLTPDDTIRLHCGDGCLHGVSSAGKQLWPPAQVGQPLGYAAPIVDRQGNTWISAFDGGLLHVDPNGRLQKPGPYFRSRQKFNSAGVVHAGVLYVGSEDGYMFAIQLDAEQGVNLWDHAAEQGYTGWYIHSAPAITEDGVVVVAGSDEHLYGFAPDGRQLWQTPLPGQMLGSPVIDPHGHIYLGVSQSQRGQEPQGMLVSIDGNSHKLRWECRAAGPVESTPVVGDDGLIYFGDNSGHIHAADPRGSIRWTAQVESPVRSAGTLLAPGRLAFGLDNETLVVLKCSSGGLASGGWPKLGRTLRQCGIA